MKFFFKHLLFPLIKPFRQPENSFKRVAGKLPTLRLLKERRANEVKLKTFNLDYSSPYRTHNR
ncbi:MAG: hypothetical protein IJV35_00710 [Neisseriaceae bacterium]|nr:hypothetical protein [Neisseriaceae bacterium]